MWDKEKGRYSAPYCQTYDEQVRFLFHTDAGFAAAVALLEGLSQRSNFQVLHFSHYDADGIASAFIMRRLLRRRFGGESP